MKIRNIMRLRNVFIYDKEMEKSKISFKGVLLIEYEDYKRSILDLKTMEDITNTNKEVIIRRFFTIPKYLFKEN